MLIHLDDFIGMNDRQIKPLRVVFRQFSANGIFTAHQVDAHVILARRLYSARDNFARSVIATHSVQGHSRGRRNELGSACGPYTGFTHTRLPSGSPMVALTRSTSLSRSKGL